MSNLDNASGLQVWGEMLGAHLYALATSYGTAVYLGAMMETDGTSYATKYGGGVPGCAVEEGGAFGSLLGSAIAIFDSDMDPVNYLAASTAGDSIVAGYVLIADHPRQKFIAQEDSDGNSIEATEVGLNADMAGTGGSTTTGISTMEIDSTSAATTNTLAVKILSAHPDDTIASANCRFIVMINTHHRASNVVGA